MARMVIIKLSRDVALHLQQGLADLNCWVRGFGTAVRLNGQPDLEPIGLGEARDLNVILKGALEDLDEDDPVWEVLSEVWKEAFRIRQLVPEGSESQRIASYLHDVAVNLCRKHDGSPFVAAAAWPLSTPKPDPEF